MAKASRESQLKFMRSYGFDTLRKAMIAAFDRQGADFLTDEQLSNLVSEHVRKERFTAQLHRTNRKIRKAA